MLTCPLTRGEPDRKRDRAAGRVLSDTALDAMIARAVPRVPVTRVSEVSRLERGAAPVFSATTPLARDLTTHMGKGLTRRAARISAVMEAIERVSAERVHQPVRRASLQQMQAIGEACLDPVSCDLPPSTRYDPAREFSWVQGWDLLRGHALWLPLDLCQSPPAEGILDQVDTNGLASGGTYGEAIRHGLLEVIERDAISAHLFFDHFGHAGGIAPARRLLSSEGVAGVIGEVGPQQRVELEEITTDIGVPVVACRLIEGGYDTAHGPQQMVFGGWGCDPQVDIAARRALTEAHQSRLGARQGTRDSFNVMEPARHEAHRPSGTSAGAAQGALSAPPPVFGSVSQDIAWCLGKLREVGLSRVLVVNMTDPDLGVPVVRVRVPGLASYVVDRHRPGWRAMRHIL
ncbi:hypothetical protein E4Z66_03430 [Aliishimia ponticola]|uniref:YcaO domain-containing protein n=1 Tax=Aliishimia ponticola TaxID=2499833 RepID=A0A4S4NG87_9RHOB|nr:hypothetical protein E4Z66_03430 [Aliishimia ponticola]